MTKCAYCQNEATNGGLFCDTCRELSAQLLVHPRQIAVHYIIDDRDFTFVTDKRNEDRVKAIIRQSAYALVSIEEIT